MQPQQKKQLGAVLLIVGVVLLVILLKRIVSAPNSLSASGRSYTVSTGNDLSPGADLFQMNNTTASACEANCDATTGCAGFSFNGQTCWGKAAASPLVPTADVDAYIAA